MNSQCDIVPAVTDAEASDSSEELVEGERRRTLPIFSAVVLACAALAALAVVGFTKHSPMARSAKLDGHVELSSDNSDDSDVIWDQLAACVEIEQLEEELSGDLDDETRAKLEKELDALTSLVSNYAEIKVKYSDMWDDVKEAAELRELQEAVDHAKKTGSDKLDALQKELDAAKDKVDPEKLKKQVSDRWQEYADELPSLEDMKGTAKELKDQLNEATDEMVDSTFDYIASWF